jgi:cell division septation protein DedD
MNMLRIAGVALLSAVLVAGSGVAALAADGDGVCTITLQLPETAQPGAPFTLNLVEDSDCAAVTDPTTFSYGGVIDGRSFTADDGIHFDHTIGTGNFSYQGIAPRADYWHPWINGGGVQGADLVVDTMLVTWGEPEPTPQPTETSTPAPTPTGTTAPAPQPTSTATPPISRPAPSPKPTTAKPAPSKQDRYASCKAVHKHYSGGIAKAGVHRNTIKHAHHAATHGKLRGHVKHSTALYKANKKLDRDKDGILCEKS